MQNEPQVLGIKNLLLVITPPLFWATLGALFLWGFPLQLCCSVGVFIYEWSKREFFKGKHFANDEKKTTWGKWLIWQWETAPGIKSSLTLSEQAAGNLAYVSSYRRFFCLPTEVRPWGERAEKPTLDPWKI